MHRDGRTKIRRLYDLIHEKSKDTCPQSLITFNRSTSLARAEQIYRETEDAMIREVKLTSNNTHEPIRSHANERIKTITDIHHAGITKGSFNDLYNAEAPGMNIEEMQH